MIELRDEKPFAHGGNRLCFVHPHHPGRCIKVRRPEFSLEDMRRAKGFPHTLFPAARLDESRKEHAIFGLIERLNGDAAFQVLSRDYGFVDTDMGPGLCSELIRNDDGRIALSVMQYLFEYGLTASLQVAVDRFEVSWLALAIPSRDLLLHNVVAQCDAANQVRRLVVIDGLGFSGVLPFRWQTRAYRARRSGRKLAKFRALMSDFLQQKQAGTLENMFWMQLHDGAPAREQR